MSSSSSSSSSRSDTPPSSSRFRNCPNAAQAASLVDGVQLVAPEQKNVDDDRHEKDAPPVAIMPWVAYGTYKLGEKEARRAVCDALRVGYRHIDTAFIYGGEKTERQVGLALQDAVQQKIIQSREQVFLATKHWRKYHGYQASLECLRLSLRRLQVDYIDLWLMVSVKEE